MSETGPRRNRTDTLFLAFTLIGSLVCLAVSVALVVWSLQLQTTARTNQALLSIWAATAFGLMFIVGLPGVFRAWRGQRQKPAPASKPPRSWAIALALIPLGICLGSVSAIQYPGGAYLGSLGYAVSIGSVVLAIVLIMRWMGPPLSPRRAWGHFLVGLWAMPAIALVLELVMFIPSLLLLGLGLMLSPDGQTLIDMASTLVASDTGLLTESIRALSMKPWVIGLMFFNLAFLVPLLEEAIKTLATWPLLRRNPTPAQGFLGGALAGAGFSLFEALFAGEPGQAWLSILIGRTGTTLMHIFTAAITSWALVRASRDRKWGTFGLAYAGAVGLHSLWNASALGIALAGTILEADQTGTSAGYAMVVVCTGALILLALVGLALVALPWVSRKLVRQESAVP